MGKPQPSSQDFKRSFQHLLKEAIVHEDIERIKSLVIPGRPKGWVNAELVCLAAVKQKILLETVLKECPWEIQLAAMQQLFSKKDLWALRLLTAVAAPEALPGLAETVVCSNDVETMRWLFDRTPAQGLADGLDIAVKGNYWPMARFLIDELPIADTVALLNNSLGGYAAFRGDVLGRAAKHGDFSHLDAIIDGGFIAGGCMAKAIVDASFEGHDDVVEKLADLAPVEEIGKVIDLRWDEANHISDGSDEKRARVIHGADVIGSRLTSLAREIWMKRFARFPLMQTMACNRSEKAEMSSVTANGVSGMPLRARVRP